MILPDSMIEIPVCEYEDCTNTATYYKIAETYDPEIEGSGVDFYCKKHAEIVERHLAGEE